MNVTPIHPLQVLIVEDDPGTIEVLCFILEDLPDNICRIVTASTVANGRAAQAAARDERRPFDIVILDFKIPADSGLNPESDFSLAATARQWFPKAFIFQITAFGLDREIKRFTLPPDLRNPEIYDFIPKDEGWTDVIRKRIIEVRHMRRVRDAFENLFPAGRIDDEGLLAARRRPVERCDQDRRLLIASLCDDAGRHWDALSKSLQDDLTKTLGHARDAAGHHVLGVRTILARDEHEEEEIALPDDNGKSGAS